MSTLERWSETSWTAAFVPDWMREETLYSRTKFSDLNNPQRTGLNGGLKPGGLALQELAGYYDRFQRFYEQGDDEPALLLKSSMALGKFVNATKMTNVFIVRDELGGSVNQADEFVMAQAERICQRLYAPQQDFASTNLDKFFEDEFSPAVATLASVIDIHHPLRLQVAHDILKRNIELFVAFSIHTGIVAQPGISSSFEAQPWYK